MYAALLPLPHRDQAGQGLAEFALILALIAIVTILALIFLGGLVPDILSAIGGPSPTPFPSSSMSPS